MWRLYDAIFRSLYRGLRAANGPNEYHEWTASMLLSGCWLLNVLTVLLVARNWFSFDLVSRLSKIGYVAIMLGFFAVHYLLMVRGRPEESFGSREGPQWATAAAVIYVIGSLLLFFISV